MLLSLPYSENGDSSADVTLVATGCKYVISYV